MGQAKKRGTYEDRMMAARAKLDDLEGMRAEHLRILTKIEEDTAAEALEGATKLITSFVEHQEIMRKRRMGIRIGGNNGKESAS